MIGERQHEAKRLNALIRNIRLSFNLLRSKADEMHKDLGVNASMRGVMESLTDHAEKTVPDIARAKGVSRQHIQVIVNGLIEAKIVSTRHNPQDKRTYLVSLTKSGQEIFKKIQARETEELERLVEVFYMEELSLAIKTLQKLNTNLKGKEDG